MAFMECSALPTVAGAVSDCGLEIWKDVVVKRMQLLAFEPEPSMQNEQSRLFPRVAFWRPVDRLSKSVIMSVVFLSSSKSNLGCCNKGLQPGLTTQVNYHAQHITKI
jgi:hypothetical protein